MTRLLFGSAVIALFLHGAVSAQPASPKSPYTAEDAAAGRRLNDKAQEIRKGFTNPFGPAEPFQMIGNLYFVGIENGDGYLLTSSGGHILFGAGFRDSGPAIEKNIESLGFKISDVKVILINHAHPDQAGGTLYLQQKSGAKVMAAFAEIPFLEHGGAPAPPAGPPPLPGANPAAPPAVAPPPPAPPFSPVRVDRALNDGDLIKVGSSTVTAYLIPGHSAASTSFVFNVRDGRREYKAIQYCCWEYPADLSRGYYINEASVRRGFETLHKIGPIDIYMELGRYAWGGVVDQPDGLTVFERIENVKKNPLLLVNRNTFRQMNAGREAEFDEKLAKLRETHPLYAQ